MTSTEARDAVKQRMGIPSVTTTFDIMIDGLVSSAVRRLYPRAGKEVASQEVTSFTVDDLGECVIDLTALSTAVTKARQVEAYDNYSWSRITDTYHHAGTLRLRGLTGTETKLRIYGVNPFSAMTDVNDWLTQSVIWWAMSEFYDYLAGNKKSYNIYMQVSGSRAVDNMADQSAYYDSKADRYIDEQGKVYGG